MRRNQLPVLPEGWTWGPDSDELDAEVDYLSRQFIQLIGPAVVHKKPWGNQTEELIYSTKLKKFSACCGIGHATYFEFPEKPEQDKLELLLAAVEMQNLRVQRGVSLLTLSKYYDSAFPLIKALQARGWTQGFEFANMVWHQDSDRNRVSLWYKDCAPEEPRRVDDDDEEDAA